MLNEFIKLENQLADQLSILKQGDGLFAVKAEFEAEGASFRDLMRLRILTARQEVPLYLKIGGVEALRDIKDAMELGVDGLKNKVGLALKTSSTRCWINSPSTSSISKICGITPSGCSRRASRICSVST